MTYEYVISKYKWMLKHFPEKDIIIGDEIYKRKSLEQAIDYLITMSKRNVDIKDVLNSKEVMIQANVLWSYLKKRA